MTGIKHTDRTRIEEARRILTTKCTPTQRLTSLDELLNPPPLAPGADTDTRRSHDNVSFGWCVLAINMHGVAVALGPYQDESEMHNVAELAALLCGPVIVIDLDAPLGERGSVDASRYGTDEGGIWVDKPDRRPPTIRPEP